MNIISPNNELLIYCMKISSSLLQPCVFNINETLGNISLGLCTLSSSPALHHLSQQPSRDGFQGKHTSLLHHKENSLLYHASSGQMGCRGRGRQTADTLLLHSRCQHLDLTERLNTSNPPIRNRQQAIGKLPLT